MKTRALILILSLALLVVAGCVDTSGRGNPSDNASAPAPAENLTPGPSNGTAAASNDTNSTIQIAPSWPRYNTSSFSFPYMPGLDMSLVRNGANGVISAENKSDNSTQEVMAVKYVDTVATYGQNRDSGYKADPTKAASDFLLQDKAQDTFGFFMKADSFGDLTTFALGRDAYCAQMPFTIRFDSGTVFHGYAITLYIPERSMLLDVRILAIDASVAKEMRDQFLYGFSLG